MRRSTRYAIITTAVAGWSVGSVLADELSFFWFFDTQNNTEIVSCDTLNIGFSINPNATVKATPPYYLIVYPLNYIPSVFNAGSGGSKTWPWQVGYPAGTSLLLSFVDSAGNSGGVGTYYDVTNFNRSVKECPQYGLSKSPLYFTVNPQTCELMNVEVSGGVPPYTLTRIFLADTARNSSFTGSSIHFNNTLTAGGEFLLSVSDSNHDYANSTDLFYSQGGGDTSCLTDTSASSGPATQVNPRRGYPAVIGGAVAALGVLAAVVVFFYYRRRYKLQQAKLAGSQGNGLDGTLGGQGGRSFMSGAPWLGKGSNHDSGEDAWRPESVIEYPTITNGPGRFRVTNPDDDAQSQFSLAMTGGASRKSKESSRNSKHPGTSKSMEGPIIPRLAYNPGITSPQRQSLIEGDHNALYPPTESRFSATTVSSGGRGVSHIDEFEESWPTHVSAASSTEDHYMDHPASSAGILSGRNSNENPRSGSSVSQLRSPTSASTWRQIHPLELGGRQVYNQESMSPSPNDGRYRSLHALSRTESSTSNAAGSPFADSQRVREADISES